MTPAESAHDDIEFLKKLRVEWKNCYDECCRQRDAKGYVDAELREKCAKLDQAMNERVDKISATQAAHAATIDEQQKQIKGLMERSSRPPGSGGPGLLEAPKSLAQQVVESEAFKNCQWNGRIHVQTTIKGRLRPDATKAATTIIEGGPTVITPPVGAYPIFPYRVGLIPQQFPPLVMRDVVPVIPLDGTNAVEYVRETWTTPYADYQVNEGDKKAQKIGRAHV